MRLNSSVRHTRTPNYLPSLKDSILREVRNATMSLLDRGA
nr:putative integron gene cassette protein [uncultured bacterium]